MTPKELIGWMERGGTFEVAREVSAVSDQLRAGYLVERVKFAAMAGSLLDWAYSQQISVIVTDWDRSQEEQDRLFVEGKSKVQHSKHQDWLAIDLCLVKNGTLIWEECDEYTRLGEYWESIGGTWGGRWSSLHDIYHFEL